MIIYRLLLIIGSYVQNLQIKNEVWDRSTCNYYNNCPCCVMMFKPNKFIFANVGEIASAAVLLKTSWTSYCKQTENYFHHTVWKK